MPPKRKAAALTLKGGKKTKKEESTALASMKDAAVALKTEDQKKGGKKSRKADTYSTDPLYYPEVVDDYDCMLNQTNVGHNNNKFYVIQVLKSSGTYYVWNRWGRVGEPGANAYKGPLNLAGAVKEFEKKFKNKTKNNWSDRNKFKPVSGKYTLIEMADEDEIDAPPVVSIGWKKVAKSTLDVPTQNLLKLIFDNDMFNDCMKQFDIDVKKLPLGKLSKSQIAKGFEVLDEIESELKANRRTKLNELSSRFYTAIPHAFGRKTPPIIDIILGDIEIAQSLQKEKEKKMKKKVGDEHPNPYDVNYDLLNCSLTLLDKKSREYQVIQHKYTSDQNVIEKYTTATAGVWHTPKIKEVWKVDRIGEDKRFAAHDGIGNRRLLWHGTDVAVVAAILKSGLRIMPHSGGRVGAGIYFASENNQSAAFVGTVKNKGIMFLNEVVLGKQYPIKRENYWLKAAPKGYDSVIAQGRTEPDPKQYTQLKFGKHFCDVPQSKPIANHGCSTSSFFQSEYLIYKESQNRIRYLLLMDF